MTAVGWDDDGDGCTGTCCTTVVLKPLLPLRTRIRLGAVRRIDQTAARLVAGGHFRSARWLWRACRLL